MGAMEPGRWQFWQARWKMGATSLENVGMAWSAAEATDCAAPPRAPAKTMEVKADRKPGGNMQFRIINPPRRGGLAGETACPTKERQVIRYATPFAHRWPRPLIGLLPDWLRRARVSSPGLLRISRRRNPGRRGRSRYGYSSGRRPRNPGSLPSRDRPE